MIGRYSASIFSNRSIISQAVGLRFLGKSSPEIASVRGFYRDPPRNRRSGISIDSNRIGIDRNDSDAEHRPSMLPKLPPPVIDHIGTTQQPQEVFLDLNPELRIIWTIDFTNKEESLHLPVSIGGIQNLDVNCPDPFDHARIRWLEEQFQIADLEPVWVQK